MKQVPKRSKKTNIRERKSLYRCIIMHLDTVQDDSRRLNPRIVMLILLTYIGLQHLAIFSNNFSIFNTLLQNNLFTFGMYLSCVGSCVFIITMLLFFSINLYSQSAVFGEITTNDLSMYHGINRNFLHGGLTTDMNTGYGKKFRNVVYFIYIIMWQANTFIFFPPLIGFISVITLPVEGYYSVKDALGPFYCKTVYMITPLSFAIVVLYFLQINSALPSRSLIAATNPINQITLVVSVIINCSLDRYITSFTRSDNSLSFIIFLTIFKVSPSLIACIWNVYHTYFFNKYGRTINCGIHLMNVLMSILFISFPNIQLAEYTARILIPACLFLPILCKLVLNLDTYKGSTHSINIALQAVDLYKEMVDNNIDVNCIKKLILVTGSKYTGRYGMLKHVLHLFDTVADTYSSRRTLALIYKAYYSMELNPGSLHYVCLILKKLPIVSDSSQRALERHIQRGISQNNRRNFIQDYYTQYSNLLLLKSYLLSINVQINMLYECLSKRKFEVHNLVTKIYNYTNKCSNLVFPHGHPKQMTYSTPSNKNISKGISAIKHENDLVFSSGNMLLMLPYAVMMRCMFCDSGLYSAIIRKHLEICAKLAVGNTAENWDNIMALRVHTNKYSHTSKSNKLKYQPSYTTSQTFTLNLNIDTTIIIQTSLLNNQINYVSNNTDSTINMKCIKLMGNNLHILMNSDFKYYHSNYMLMHSKGELSQVEAYDKDRYDTKKHDELRRTRHVAKQNKSEYGSIRELEHNQPLHMKSNMNSVSKVSLYNSTSIFISSRPYIGKDKHRYIHIDDNGTILPVVANVQIQPLVDTTIHYMICMKPINDYRCIIMCNGDGIIYGYSSKLVSTYSNIVRYRLKSISELNQELFDHTIGYNLRQNNERATDPNITGRDGISTNNTAHQRLVDKVGNKFNTSTIIVIIDNRLVQVNIEYIYSSCYTHIIFDLVFGEYAIEDKSNQYIEDMSNISLASNLSKHQIKNFKERGGTGSNSSIYVNNDKNKEDEPINIQSNKKNSLKSSNGSWNSSVNTSFTTSASKYSSNKVNRCISVQEHKIVIKEYMTILLIQLAVWITCLSVLLIIDFNFNGKMISMIEVRRGLHIFALANEYIMTGSSTLFEQMYYRQGYISDPANLYKPIIPEYTRNLTLDTVGSITESQIWVVKLNRIVASFPPEFGGRYTYFKTNYSIALSDSGAGKYMKIYSKVDIPKMYTLSLYAFRRLNNELVAGNNVTFEHNTVKELAELYAGQVLDALGTPTVLLLMQADIELYQTQITNARLLLNSMIIISLILGNGIILMVYLIKLKIDGVYEILKKLYVFEIKDHYNNMLQLNPLISRIGEGNRLLLNQSTIYRSKVIDSSNGYLSNQRYAFKSKNNQQSSTSSCYSSPTNYGYGVFKYSCLTFIFMELFCLLCIAIVNNVFDENKYKIEMMNYSRSFMTSTSLVHFINFRMYLLVAYNAELFKPGTVTGNSLVTGIQVYLKSIDTLITSLRSFLHNHAADPTYPLLGFDYLLDKPCNFVDLGKYKLTKLSCQNLAKGVMNNSVLDVYKWAHFELGNIVNAFGTYNKTSIIDLLQSESFIELQLVKESFMLPFLVQISDRIYDQLLTFHERVNTFIRELLGVLLVIGILMCIAVDYYMKQYLNKQIAICLMALRILPPKSYYRNTYVASKIQLMISN